MSYEVFTVATLGVASYAMKRTGSGKPMVQEEGGTNMKATCSLKQSHPSLLAETNAYFYMLQLFCDWLLRSITVSIAN